jgi:hypothetical protein
MRRSLWIMSLGGLLLGCPNTDEAVFVEPTIRSPSATLEQSALVDALGGAFVIHLHLGPRATGSATVELVQLSVVSADRMSTLHAPLEVSTNPSFPVTVGVDSDVTIDVTFSPDDNELDMDALDPICDPTGIVIAASLTDSLRGGSVPTASETFAVGQCP